MNLIENFKAARRVGTPIVAIKTPDAESLMQQLQLHINGAPVFQWDVVRGPKARSESARNFLSTLEEEDREGAMNPVSMLELAMRLPAKSILFMHNLHRYLGLEGQPANPAVIQGIWNLRDPFKGTQAGARTLIILGFEFTLPAELRQDVLVLDEPLPDEEALREIVANTIKAAKMDITEDVQAKATDALRGLAAFPAEQTVAMCLHKKINTLDVDAVWDRKRQQLSERKALTVWRGGENFSSIGGLDAIKEKFNRIKNGRRPPKVCVWLDEGEKSGLGAQGDYDLSGTSTDQMSVLLTEMVDKDYTGAILEGVPGSGKSMFAKAFGNECGVLTVRLDLGASKGQGLVGQAENEIRENMKIIEAIGGVGGAFFLMTSNNIAGIKTELKSRFHKGIWFFDLPTAEEQSFIWKLYLDQYPEIDRNLDSFYHDGWTGREIRACVMTAWEENISLAEAAKYVIPVAISGKEVVEKLRREADRKYLSASYPGVYDYGYSQQLKAVPTSGLRQFSEEIN
jgi:hypothetical protein